MSGFQPHEDIAAACDLTDGLWEELRDARLFLTGATGFLGRWMVALLAEANRRRRLGLRATLLTRDARETLKRMAWLADEPWLELYEGDVRSGPFPPGDFSHVVHGAAPVGMQADAEGKAEMMDVIINGTRLVLGFASDRGARDLLFLSSGAVYGPQPPDLAALPEDHPGCPETHRAGSAYAAAKRAAETLCAAYGEEGRVRPRLARCFAFLGPHLPLDGHFAAGNFIRDATRGGPVKGASDGSAVRSYLYAADAAVWLWTILLRGRPLRPYNVGSPEAVSIADFAREVAEAAGGCPAVFEGRPGRAVASSVYLPDVSRAAAELGLRPSVGRREAIRRTLAWARESAP